jgi:hypothetical protein
MAIFESFDKLNPDGFLKRLQNAWQQSGSPEPLKLSAPSPTQQEPSPLQIATNNPSAPSPNLADQDRTFWLDLNPPKDKEVFSTAIGSGVISPTIHKLMQAAQSGDVAQRFEFCNQLKILFENDYTVSTCINARIEGACRLGVKQEVVPDDDQDNNPVAIESAQRANRTYHAAAKFFLTSEREMALREYVLFGGIYDRLAWNQYGTITDLMGLPSQTMKILVNSQLKLNDGQLVAYQQFDPFIWGKPSDQFSDLQVICIRNRMLRSDVYGSTFILSIIKYIQDNIRTMDLVQQSRIGDLPLNVEQREDAIGNPVHPSVLAKAQWESIQARIARGERVDTHHIEWINGRGTMSRLESSGNYYNNFSSNDVKYRASAIAGVLGRSLAMIITPEGVNRATAEWLTESDFDRENKLAMAFCDTHDVALMQKSVFVTNLSAAAADSRWGMEPGRYYIDPRLIKLKSDIVGQVTEDRAMARVDHAGNAVDRKIMPIKRAAYITAQAYKIDPDQYWQELLRENPALRVAYPEDYIDPTIKTLPPSITSQPNEDNSDPEQVM